MAAITKGPLKDFLATRKSNTVLVSRIDRYLQTRKPDTSRRTDVLHPSEIVGKDWCLRASYHLLRGAEPKRSNHPLRMENIFRTGHDIHAKVQDWAGQAGYLYGYWKCVGCQYVTKEMLLGPPSICAQCLADTFTYAEIGLSIPELMISGHTDGWLKFPDDEDHLLEIKSIGMGTIRYSEPSLVGSGGLEEAFKKISRPFPSHVRQVQVYLEALHVEFGDDSPDKALFWYECKANQEVREFVVERNPDLIRDVLEKADLLVDMVENNIEPKCSIKPDSACAKCKEFA